LGNSQHERQRRQRNFIVTGVKATSAKRRAARSIRTRGRNRRQSGTDSPNETIVNDTIQYTRTWTVAQFLHRKRLALFGAKRHRLPIHIAAARFQAAKVTHRREQRGGEAPPACSSNGCRAIADGKKQHVWARKNLAASLNNRKKQQTVATRLGRVESGLAIRTPKADIGNKEREAPPARSSNS
jgi:hypothetical protein